MVKAAVYLRCCGVHWTSPRTRRGCEKCEQHAGRLAPRRIGAQPTRPGADTLVEAGIVLLCERTDDERLLGSELVRCSECVQHVVHRRKDGGAIRSGVRAIG